MWNLWWVKKEIKSLTEWTKIMFAHVWIIVREPAPTSDFTSSDFALAESMFFIGPWTSSSLLMDGVLPFDSGWTAGGATVAKEKNVFLLNSGRREEVQQCSFVSHVITEQMRQRKEKVASKLITLPCVGSDLSELPALVQEQSELFNTSILKKPERREWRPTNPIKMFIYKIQKHTQTKLRFLLCQYRTNVFHHMAFASKQ